MTDAEEKQVYIMRRLPRSVMEDPVVLESIVESGMYEMRMKARRPLGDLAISVSEEAWHYEDDDDGACRVIMGPGQLVMLTIREV